MVIINVRGLPRDMTENKLENLFGEHGRVFDLRLAKDIFSGHCKGVAELKMEGHEARAARQALNGAAMDGSLVQVTVRTPKTPPRYKAH